MYNISDILKLPIAGKTVVIIGAPATGKTWLSNALNTKGHTVFHTDDYIPHGHIESLYVLMDEIESTEGPKLIEGVNGYRLLRKGVELDSFYPDIVIELFTTPERIMQTYTELRDPLKLKGQKGFTAALAKILRDYHAMPNRRPPTWVQVMNEY